MTDKLYNRNKYMRYWETRKKCMCFNACDNEFKQRDVNPLLWMQVNEDDENGITNNIQEVCMTRLPGCSATKDQNIQIKQTYININTYVTLMQWCNNPCTGGILKKPIWSIANN